MVLLAAIGLRAGAAWATHIRAGDIQAKVDTTANPNPRRIFFKMVLYTDRVTSNVDEARVAIFFGDGTSSCAGGVVRATKRLIPGNADTDVNIYYFEHTYPSTGSFLVSYIGENRNAGVLNMSNSANQTFFISTTITIDPALGLNRSPVLTAPAVDRGAIGQVFLHNPAAYDADGDSLSFKLRTCQQVPLGVLGTVGPPCPGATGNNTPAPQICPNYRYPNDPLVTPGTAPVTVPPAPVGPALFVINERTGQLTWNAPVVNGIYNAAIVVEEWRRTAASKRLIGTVIRDMQIIVTASVNLRPTITIPADLCVVAGQRVTGVVTATDAEAPASPQTPVSLFAYSGIIPPATFTQTQTGPPTARGTFNWQTNCSNVARLPYLVVFKAQDSPNPPSPTNPILIDQKTWSITVVGPAPQNLRATNLVSSVRLDWNLYQCANAAQIYIYRKVNPSGFVPGPCDTGIPASAGYTRIGNVAPTATSFVDNTVPLERGQTYCYRIYAEFPLPAGGASIASQEACVTIAGRAAMLTNVDVVNTSTSAGQIQVRWTKPRTSAPGGFDGALSYVLSRGEGANPGTFVPVRAPFTAITDTSYVDTGLNTENLQYTYRLQFVRTFGGSVPAITETSPTATSVRTNAVPANPAATAVSVTWTYNVPWDNTAQPTTVYRRTGRTGPYVAIGTATSTATGGAYTDRDPTLRKGENYCYYVQTNGRYAGFSFLSSLLNKSQEKCMVLNSPPCTPVLALQATNCDSLASLQEFPGLSQRYANRLKWTLSNQPTGCDATIASYNVYYRPMPTGAFALIGTTTFPSFVHDNLEFSGGCYAVQAIAPSGVRSDTSNVACQDNCVFFKLPNIFTPNGDAQNAVFRPKNNSPVRSIRFKAFNRWGVQVFENTTTSADRILINWDGGGPVGESNGTGAKVVDGIYYYLAEVEFADFANTKRTYKGWVEIIR
ncbi:hypothetical protein GCM10022407_11390 [Hymenobacter antarcticus]|uniref:Gliding motility-associated C-terminal domain-containing protein n=2 Tax=Hymenobacter antarcticus TaxID=486270 RepID=A0ABP7PJT3_9BACT